MTEPKLPQTPPGPPGRHPTPPELYRAAAGPRTPAVEATLAHAAACAECSAELARLEAFNHPAPVAPHALDAAWRRFERGEGVAANENRPRRAAVWALPLAALLALGVGLAVWQRTQQSAPGPTAQPAPPVHITKPAIPGPPGSDGPRGGPGEQPADALSPLGPLAAPPRAFRFTNPDGASRHVLVFDEGQKYLWTSDETTGTAVPFPASEQAKLKPGAHYFWTVVGADNEQMPAQSFTLRPAG